MNAVIVTPLAGRVALVTGASRGIGLAISTALAEAGAAVGLVARHARELDTAAAALRSKGARVAAVTADVSRRAECQSAAASIAEQLGPIDILVNNAAIQGPIGLLDEVSPQDCTTNVETNLLGPVWLMQAVLPGMKQRRRGTIINLSGGGAATPRERFAMYAATKAALVRLTETLARETESFGVRVNAVAPGAVNTKMTAEVEAAGARAGQKAMEEVKRQRQSGGASPENAAELVVYLASDASAGISGRMISAVWDDWRQLRATGSRIADPDLFTLRRVSVSAAS